MSRKVSVLVTLCLLGLSFFIVACQKDGQSAHTPLATQSPVSPDLRGSTMAATNTQDYWNAFDESHKGISSSSEEIGPPVTPMMMTSFSSAGLLTSGPMYDPLDGATLGVPNFPGYGPGYAGQAAKFTTAYYNGAPCNIQYAAGSQIPLSGTIEFYINTTGYVPVYCSEAFIFTQCGHGPAYDGDLYLALYPGNVLGLRSMIFGPWLFSPPIPINQWVKIKVTYGDSGLSLSVNDQVVASSPDFKKPITSRPFYFGSREWYRDATFAGKLDEIRAYSASSLKIVAPASGSVFDFGQSVDFVAQAVGSCTNVEWSSSIDGSFAQGLSVTTSILSPGTHTITIRGVSAGVQVSDSIVIGVNDVAEIRIKNIDAGTDDPFADNFAVSYRAAKTRFQAIGYRSDHVEIGPVPVDWHVEGGAVVATEQMRMQILSFNDAPSTIIGNLEGFASLAGKKEVTFNSYLPGNISVVAKKGNASDSVSIRIKQPTFKVEVYPIEGVDTAIFESWKAIVKQVWEQEDIIHVESVNLNSAIPNVTYPQAPLDPLPPDFVCAEPLLLPLIYEDPSYLNPIVYDYLLEKNWGLRILPRQSSVLFSQIARSSRAINVFVTQDPQKFVLKDYVPSPPPDAQTVMLSVADQAMTSRDYYDFSSHAPLVDADKASIVVEAVGGTPTPQHLKLLAHSIGHLLGLGEWAEWSNQGNLMNSGQYGGRAFTPEQYINVLNYHGDNPQNAAFIWEK